MLAQDLPGNHRGGRSRLFGGSFLLEGCSGGICSTRIDFQLGTNAADTNGSNRQMEGCWQKNSDVGSSSWSAGGLAIPGSCPVIARKTTGGHPHSTRRKRPGTRVYRGYPQHSMKNAPKMHSDITVAKVVVHISCADCHGAVIQPSSAVGACNQNLSQ